MSLTFWLQFVLVCVIGAMSPGPSVALIIKNSVTFSRTAGILSAIGHALGIGIYAILAILGLHYILITNPFIFNSIQIIGSIFLLGLGVMFLIDKSTNLQIEETQKNVQTFLLNGQVDNYEKYQYMVGQLRAYEGILQEISTLLTNKEPEDNENTGTVIDINTKQ